jgi:glc operon protein GlcG
MKGLSLVTLAAAAALMSATAPQAQPAPSTPPPLPEYGGTVTLEQAMKMGNAALAEAKKLNVKVGITVVGNAGRLVYFMKMDDTRQIGVNLSQGKAHTAAVTKVPSKAYEDRVAAGGAGLWSCRWA